MKRKMISTVVLLAFLFSSVMPLSVFAQGDVSDAKKGLDYSLFSSSSDTALSINSANANIVGDVRTNNNFAFQGSSLTIDGSCESAGKIDTKDKKSSITNKTENVSVIPMPDVVPDIKSIASEDAEIYNSSKKYNENVVSLSNSIIVNGDVFFNGSKFNSKGYVVASGDIIFNSAKIETSAERGIVICSENGNITINGSNAIFKGILYAPKGTVTINTADFTLIGRIFAEKIIVRGSKFNIAGSNEECLELINGLQIKENPVLSIEILNDSVKLNWTLVKNAAKYTVLRQIDENEYETIADDLVLGTFTDTDLNVYGIYTYKVMALNTKNESKDSNEVIAYVSELGNGIINNDNTDTDRDGLPDWLELRIDTDPLKWDSDGDGLPDGYEYYTLGTSPLKVDTDENDILDGEEDFDEDGLTNLEEFSFETNPWLADSDLDGLTDYEELKIYNTDPNNEDTDEDELTDGNEILYGTNPLSPDTNNDGIKDGDEVFQ